MQDLIGHENIQFGFFPRSNGTLLEDFLSVSVQDQIALKYMFSEPTLDILA